MNYLKLLERSHKSWLFDDEDLSRMEYLVSHLFEITTYDGGQDEIIGKKLFETIDAITNRKTFEYIENKENYTWYLMFCNFSFFENRLNWGTSIRGAWWDYAHHLDKTMKFSTCGLLGADGEQQTEWEFTREEWAEFMTACVEYSRGESS